MVCGPWVGLFTAESHLNSESFKHLALYNGVVVISLTRTLLSKHYIIYRAGNLLSTNNKYLWLRHQQVWSVEVLPVGCGQYQRVGVGNFPPRYPSTIRVLAKGITAPSVSDDTSFIVDSDIFGVQGSNRNTWPIGENRYRLYKNGRQQQKARWSAGWCER